MEVGSRGNTVYSATVFRSSGYGFDFRQAEVVVTQCIARLSADLVVMGSNSDRRVVVTLYVARLFVDLVVIGSNSDTRESW